MNIPARIAAFCAVAVFTTGCDPLDRLAGRSPGRDHIEHVAALAAAAPPMTVARIAPEPIPEPEPAPVMPVCRFSDAGFLICN